LTSNCHQHCIAASGGHITPVEYSFCAAVSNALTLAAISATTIFYTKYIAVTLFLVGLYDWSFGQDKIVKLYVDSTQIYFRYFYKSKYVSDYILNDSVRAVGRKISADKFYLDKYINKKKVWTKVCQIELAKDSLHVTTRIGGKTGKDKFKHTKESYYNSFLTDN
jgi:hypothetical protein